MARGLAAFHAEQARRINTAAEDSREAQQARDQRAAPRSSNTAPAFQAAIPFPSGGDKPAKPPTPSASAPIFSSRRVASAIAFTATVIGSALVVMASQGSGFGLFKAPVPQPHAQTQTAPSSQMVKGSLSQTLQAPTSSAAMYAPSLKMDHPLMRTASVLATYGQAGALDNVEATTQFKLAPSLAPNQVARKVAQTMVPNHPLGALIATGEGFRPTLYKDNIGQAIGFGWNVSMQSAHTNRVLGEALDLPISQQAAMMGAGSINPHHGTKFVRHGLKMVAVHDAGAANHARSETEAVNLSPQRAMQASLLLAEGFRADVIKTIDLQIKHGFTDDRNHKKHSRFHSGQELFDSLSREEQAALVYHAYKVGGGGYAKYHGLGNALQAYAELPPDQRSHEEACRVTQHISYSYVLDGVKKMDLRAQALVGAMWMSRGDTAGPEHVFAALISSDVKAAKVAAKQMSDLLPTESLSVSEDGLDIQDPIGDAHRAGKALKFVPGTDADQKIEQAKTTIFQSHMNDRVVYTNRR